MSLIPASELRSEGTGPVARFKMRWHLALPTVLAQIAVGLAFVAFWQLCWTYRLVDTLIARSPLQVWNSLVQLSTDGTIWPALYSTLEATLVAFALASIVGIIVGISLGLLPRVEALFEPYINAVNTMPRIAFAPIFTLFFGIGQNAKIALAFSIVVFMVMVSARAGVRTIDRDLLLMAKVMNTPPLQMFTKIMIPTALPYIFAGLRLGLVYSLFGVITSEILSSRVGLGHLISRYASIFQLEHMYAVIIVMTVVAAALSNGMNRVEKHLLRWRTEI